MVEACGSIVRRSVWEYVATVRDYKNEILGVRAAKILHEGLADMHRIGAALILDCARDKGIVDKGTSDADALKYSRGAYALLVDLHAKDISLSDLKICEVSGKLYDVEGDIYYQVADHCTDAPVNGYPDLEEIKADLSKEYGVEYGVSIVGSYHEVWVYYGPIVSTPPVG